jgi:hypothetical protein
MQSSTESASLHAVLGEITDIDKKIVELEDEVDKLKARRESLAEIAVEELTTQRFDGLKVAGRSWRVEWTHSFSAPEARKEAVMEAAKKEGLLGEVTSVNTTRLKTILIERGKAAGKDERRPYSEGTVFEGLVGEFVKPVLRHRSV